LLGYSSAGCIRYAVSLGKDFVHLGTFRSICAVPSSAVFFCGSLMMCFPGMLLRYYLSDFEMVSVGPVVTHTTFVLTYHIRCISDIFVF